MPPIGLYSELHIHQALAKLHRVTRNSFTMSSSEEAQVFSFQDGSYALGFVRNDPSDAYFDGALAILPVALGHPSPCNRSPRGMQAAIAKDLPKWRDYMSGLPKLGTDHVKHARQSSEYR